MKTNLKLLSATGLLFIITAGGIKAQVEKLPTSGNMGLEHIPVWLTSGNTGNNPNIQFLGTIDNQALVFRTNNIARMWITNTGNIGIGTSSPSAKLQVTGGDAIINGITVGRGKGAGVANTAAGDQALFSNTTGFGNTALGDYVLYHNTSGRQNTGNGTYSLFYNTTGVANTANGMESLVSNTTGNHNTATGYNALSRNTTGNYNIANGTYTLNANTTGNYNTALGFQSFLTGAAFSNSTAVGANAAITASNQVSLGDANVTSLFCRGAYSATTSISPNMYVSATGQIMRSTTGVGGGGWGLTGNAGTVDGVNFIGTTDNVPFNIRVNNQKAGRIDINFNRANTFYGYQAGNSNTDEGKNNTAIGYQALFSNTIGTFNNATGFYALFYNTAGFANTANGYHALFSNTTGNGNTANGSQALFSNITGNENTVNGYNALYSNTTGSNNTANGSTALYRNTTGSGNTANGVSALVANTTGYNNTANGRNSLFNNTTGYQNAANGFNALGNNTTGTNNTANGNLALNANTTGNYNTALGYYSFPTGAAFSNSTAIGANAAITASNQVRLGDNNVTSLYSMGAYASTTSIAPNMYVSATGQIMRSTTGGGGGWGLTGNAGTIDGTNFIGTTDNVPFNIRVNNQKAGRIEAAVNTANTFYGYLAGNSNTSGTHNIATGYQVLFSNTSGKFNMAHGVQALYSNTMGHTNTAFGYRSLYSNTTGNINTAIGNGALQSNITGSGNIANGYFALSSNTTGSGNLAIGSQALQFNTNGYGNTAIGTPVLASNISGYYNTGTGYFALTSNTTGFENTASGYYALNNNISGSNNASLGSFADVAAGNLNNATAIGNGAIVNNSNKVRIGNANVTVVESAAGSWTVSDERFKTNIMEEVKGLEFIKLLRPVVYNFNANKYEQFVSQDLPDSIKASRKEMMNKSTSKISGIRQTGFIAQEVEIAAKKSGYNFNGVHAPENPTDNYSISYEKLVVPLVKAVQELSNKNDALQLENEALKDRLDKIEQRLTANSKTFENISSARLEQNAPNPYKGNTIINYYVPFNAGNAVIKITDMKGSLLKTFNVKEGKGQVVLQSDQLATGTYQYSLFVNGRLIDTKQMMLIR